MSKFGINQELFNRAMHLKCEERFDESLNLLKSLPQSTESAPFLNTVIGAIHAQIEELEPAEHYFKEALALNDRIEVASSGLFHILMETNRHDEAMEEMVRYLSKYQSKKKRYVWILEDLLEGIKDPRLDKFREFILQQATKYGIL